jgi:hypothetical protein
VEILFLLHSWLRWIVLIIAAIAIVKSAIGLLRKQPYDRMANGVVRGYSGLLDLQGLLGLIYLLVTGFSGVGFPMHRFEHLGAMIVAMVLGHLPARLKAANDGEKYRNALLAITGSVLVILAGIAVLGGSRWEFRF